MYRHTRQLPAFCLYHAPRLICDATGTRNSCKGISRPDAEPGAYPLHAISPAHIQHWQRPNGIVSWQQQVPQQAANGHPASAACLFAQQETTASAAAATAPAASVNGSALSLKPTSRELPATAAAAASHNNVMNSIKIPAASQHTRGTAAAAVSGLSAAPSAAASVAVCRPDTASASGHGSMRRQQSGRRMPASMDASRPQPLKKPGLPFLKFQACADGHNSWGRPELTTMIQFYIIALVMY